MIFAAYVAFIVYYHIEGKEKIPLENIKVIALLLLILIMIHILMCRSTKKWFEDYTQNSASNLFI